VAGMFPPPLHHSMQNSCCAHLASCPIECQAVGSYRMKPSTHIDCKGRNVEGSISTLPDVYMAWSLGTNDFTLFI
jgi:hypothetical protein